MSHYSNNDNDATDNIYHSFLSLQISLQTIIMTVGFITLFKVDPEPNRMLQNLTYQ